MCAILNELGKMALVQRRTLDIRWAKKPRYRKFIVIGSIIFSVNVVLVHVFVSSTSNPSLDEEDPSGRGRSHGEADEDAAVHSDNEFAAERQRHIAAENEIVLKRKEASIKLSDRKASPVSTTLLSSLNVGELDFLPGCNITSKEAVSAVRRAQTQDCKRQIVNVVCSAQNKTLYPSSLPSSCPANGVTYARELGCFQDNKSMRLLSGYVTNLGDNNSPLNCINLCLQSGFPYAGVEYWTECFCGIDRPAESARLADSACNVKCPSDPRLICGGHLAINIYETGIEKFRAQVARTAVDNGNGQPARICYLLTFSGRALRQIKRLIKALYHKHHYFYIHVDARQDYLFRNLIHLEQILPNVKLMRKRHATIWAGSSLLQMLLAAMKDVLDLPWKWDFVLNLSESDFPIKNNENLVKFLTANKGRNFVKSTGKDVQRFIQKQGLDKTFVECDGHMWRVGDRILPRGIQMDGGSDWLALSRSFVQYVTAGNRDELLTGLDSLYRYTLLPAESFFHTVLRNTPFCSTYVDNNLHLTNWKRHLGCKCQYKHIVDWCGCSPNDFTLEDWPRILATTPNPIFFARKFEPIINQAVINKLQNWLYQTDQSNTVNYFSYWQSIYHHQDLSPPRDDSLVTLASSLARLAAAHLTQSKSVYLVTGDDDVVEMSSYHHDDVFQGILIRFRAKTSIENSSTHLDIESWFKVKNFFKLLDQENGKFIQNSYVTSDFDVKEQTTRSLHSALGALSDLHLVYVVEVEQTVNMTFLIVDPAGQLAQVVDVHVSEKGKSFIGSTKVLIPTPLMSGVWHLRIYHAGFLVAENMFLVLPGQPLVEKQTAEYKIAQDKLHWKSAIEGNESLKNEAASKVTRTGHELEIWIDFLTRRFYSIVELCHNQMPLSFPLEPCTETVWSSLAPDPKSSISKYDPVSGKIR